MRLIRERILYSMCYDMLQQEHFAYKTDSGFAIHCRETPLWIMPSRGRESSEARLFFEDFLRRNNQPIIGIISEKEIALACAEAYKKDYFSSELVAYYLAPEVPLKFASYELRLASVAEMPLVLEWINNFYTETLDTAFPNEKKGSSEDKPSFFSQLYVLWDSRPVAMGMLSGAGETCRLNLIYVPPPLRGNGYGKAVVSALSEKVRENGQVPMLYTACENVAANKLYTSLGFREAGRLTEVRF
ncbi:MAG: GNAT family N-acetyltransferase [Clostridiales bacterium]|jgi:predicted GNAT family acetyltransferase|nr:GNAT family N-acetyltransferase [Clostridiales bacterium]